MYGSIAFIATASHQALFLRESQAGLANLTDPFGGVCEIEDPHGLGTMKIEEALDPLGPIGWGHHVGRLFHAPPG
jgi:hypothetical protein